MNRLHVSGTSTLPLTASARHALALFETLDADENEHPSTSTSTEAAFRLARPSMLQPVRPDSPYVKARPGEDSRRTSSITSASSSVARQSTFKPLVLRNRPEHSARSTPSSSPPVRHEPDKDAFLKKQRFGRLSNSSGQPSSISSPYSQQTQDPPPPPLRPTSKKTTRPVHDSDTSRSKKVVPAIAIKVSEPREVHSRDASKSSFRGSHPESHSGDSWQQRRKPPSIAGRHVDTSKPSSAHTAHVADFPLTGRLIDPRVTMVPSSRTPSLTELPTDNLDAFNHLSTASHTFPAVINDSSTTNSRPSSLSTSSVPAQRSERRKAISTIDRPSASSASSRRVRRGMPLEYDPSVDHEIETGRRQAAKRRAISPRKAIHSKTTASQASTRATRGAQRRSAKSSRTFENGTTPDDFESTSLPPSAFVAALPRRKSVRKGPSKLSAASLAQEASDEMDEASQYLRENWDSSVSSSDEESEGGTDYDGEETLKGHM